MLGDSVELCPYSLILSSSSSSSSSSIKCELKKLDAMITWNVDLKKIILISKKV
jgi:hypothetical protein